MVSKEPENPSSDFIDACGAGDIEKMAQFLADGVDPRVRAEDGDNALLAAVKSGKIRVLELLLDHDLDVQGDSGAQALIESCWKNRNDMARLLLDRGANINAEYDDWDVPLIAALESENGVLAREFIARGADVDSRGCGGVTPLILAASSGDMETVISLLEHDADVNLVAVSGENALHLCYNYPDITRLLLERGASHAARCNLSGETTPLINCAEFGKAGTLRWLIEFGGDLNARDRENATALMYAARRGDVTAVELLLDAGADVDVKGRSVEMSLANVEGRTALMWAAASGHVAVAQRLLEGGADVNAVTDHGYTALIIATWTGNSRLLGLLLDFGADASIRDLEARTAAEYAEFMDREDLRFLIEERKANNYTKKSCDELVKAAAYGRKKKILALLKKGVSLECRGGWGHTPLLAACKWSRSKEVVRILVEAGANLEARHFTGSTPLIEACRHGDMDVIGYLVSAGADLEGRGTDGGTPLIESLKSEKVAAVELLLSLGANVDNWNDESGGTAMIHACGLGRMEIAKALLEAGAWINAVDHKKRSALMHASEKGHLNLVRLLIGKGADLNLLDKDGRTALSIASERGETELVQELTEAGAFV